MRNSNVKKIQCWNFKGFKMSKSDETDLMTYFTVASPPGLHLSIMTEVCVKVALRVRPLLPHEVMQQHKVCVRIVPDSTQVIVGSNRLFSFDHAFGPTSTQDEVYNSCVQPLVEALLRGDNATVFCYGQTGSGKTYTFEGGNLGKFYWEAPQHQSFCDYISYQPKSKEITLLIC